MARIQMDRSGEMEVFAAVVRARSFSSAAQSLDLTPSGVSKLVARLEARLGSRLLVRTTRALTLTEEGEAYFEAAAKIIQQLDEADEAATPGTVRGRLRVNASVPFGSIYVIPIAQAFMELYPQIMVDLSLTDDMIDLVTQPADVAIRVGTLSDSALMARKLGQTRRIICAAPSYLERYGGPLSPQDLTQHECLVFNFRRQPGVWPFVVESQLHNQSVNGRLSVNNGETMRQLAVAGAGIARLGHFHIAEDLEAGRLIQVLDRYNTDDIEVIHAVHVGGGCIPYRVRCFIDYLSENLRQHSVLQRPFVRAAKAPKLAGVA